MLRAHRQAWAWLDEWWGLTIDDIRAIERETQELLAKKYGGGDEDEEDAEDEEGKDREEDYEDNSATPEPGGLFRINLNK